MIKKIILGGAAAGLVLAGAASASSVGQVNDSTLAVGNFGLVNCQAGPGGAEVEFGTSQEADADTQPATAWLKTMTVSNLEGCEGATVEGQMLRTDGSGKDKMMGYFSTDATVNGGSITVSFPTAKYAAKDVTGGLLIFKNA